MKNCLALLALSALFGSLAVVTAFAPTTHQHTARSSALNAVPTVDVASVQLQQPVSLQQQQQSALQGGIQSYMASTVEDSSTLTVSLKERPPPPTKEELEAKKRNFNLCT